jgi:selenide,water dikinase
VPQAKLLQYLSALPAGDVKPNETPGMDCSVVATRHAGLFFVSTTDFFYPLVEDPYAQGRIAACNVLSDVYAMGIAEVDTVLMLLGVSSDMAPEERDATATAMIRGFNDLCREAGTSVTGGQTVSNPWPIIGGVASATVREEDMIRPEGASPGDVLVLTKALGTQVAVNAWQWRRGGKHWERLAGVLDVPAAAAAFDKATASMMRLNRRGAAAMHAHGAHGATDVTGFGLLGHASNLAEHSKARVRLELHTLPVIAGMAAADEALGGMFGLRAGRSAETSGGLLVALPAHAADAFCAHMLEVDGAPAWVVGRVVGVPEGEAGAGTAAILPDAVVLEA